MKLNFRKQTAVVILALGQVIAAMAGQSTGAEGVLGRYLEMSGSSRSDSDFGEARIKRLDVLGTLAADSNALATVEAALPSITYAWQRAELAEMMGRHIQNKESAAVLMRLMKDQDEGVRGAALHGLRLMAARIDRGGRHGIQPEPAHPPKVDGLVPALIAAADDPSANVRFSAIYALADTRDNLAMAEIRQHLQEPDRRVRLHSACLLSEVHDASGLSELKKALVDLGNLSSDERVQFYLDAEPVLLAFERLTGKSFGEIPLNPMLSNNLNKTKQLSDRYIALVKTWTDWWNWSPAAK